MYIKNSKINSLFAQSLRNLVLSDSTTKRSPKIFCRVSFVRSAFKTLKLSSSFSFGDIFSKFCNCIFVYCPSRKQPMKSISTLSYSNSIVIKCTGKLSFFLIDLGENRAQIRWLKSPKNSSVVNCCGSSKTTSISEPGKFVFVSYEPDILPL